MVRLRVDEADRIGLADIVKINELPVGVKVELTSPRTELKFPSTEMIGNNVAGDGSDVDIFGVKLEQGDFLLIDVDAKDDDGNGAISNPEFSQLPLRLQDIYKKNNINLTPRSRLNSMIRVFNANGQELRVARNGVDPESGIFSEDPVLLFQAPSSGEFFIGVTAQGNGVYNPRKLNTGNRIPSGPINQKMGAFQLELTWFDAPKFFINDVVVIEGTGGLNWANFTVSMDGPSELTHTVNFATADGTAKAGEDYGGGSGLLTFLPGVTSQNVLVGIVTDNIVELNEEFFVNLFNPTGGATIGDPQGRGIIVNDDDAKIFINDVTVVEGDSGSSLANFTLSVDNPVDTDVFVKFKTADGTATVADADYVDKVDSVKTTETISVEINGDTKVEPDETFLVELLEIQASGRVVTFGDNQGIGTIINDDYPKISISNASVIEGTGGSNFAKFTVSMDRTSLFTHTVQFTTVDNTAIAGQDYDKVLGPVTFLPGVTSRDVLVPIATDNIVELNESFFANLSNPTGGAMIADPQGVGEIINDDSAKISINDVTVVEGDSGSTIAKFSLSLDNPVDTDVFVDFDTADGTAMVGDFDYANKSGNVKTTETIEISVNGDLKVELDETFFVNLSNIQANGRDVSFADDQGMGTIINDDVPNSHIEFSLPRIQLANGRRVTELEAELHREQLNGNDNGEASKVRRQLTDKKDGFAGIINQNRDYGFEIPEGELADSPGDLEDLIDYQGFKFKKGAGTPGQFSFDFESGAMEAFDPRNNEKVLISQKITLEGSGFDLQFGIDRNGLGKDEGFCGDEGATSGGKDINANEMLFFDLKDPLLGTTGVSFAVNATNSSDDLQADVLIDFWSQEGNTFTKVKTEIIDDLTEGQIYMGAADLGTNLGMSFDAISFSSGDGERFQITNLEINTIVPDSLLV